MKVGQIVARCMRQWTAATLMITTLVGVRGLGSMKTTTRDPSMP